MESLRTLVMRLADTDRVGGRVQTVDAVTLVLYDCMSWDCYCTDSVLAHHPETRISVRSSRHSLSGFTVTFRLTRSTVKETGWFLVIGLFLAGCAYVLLRPPWWSSSMPHI